MNKKVSVIAVTDKSEESSSLVKNLREKGFSVKEIDRNGKLALAAAQLEKPDVLLIDAFMQKLDAIGVLNELGSNRTTSVFVTSSSDNPSLEKSLLCAGADYYFPKPFSPHIMAERIAQLVLKKEEERFGSVFSQSNLEIMASDILREIGVPAHIKGYNCLRLAIMLTVNEPEIIHSVTKQLYPAVAKLSKATPSKIERAIRHAIEVAWDRGNIDVLNAYFGYTIQSSRGKPTNSEFIAMISDRLRMSLKAKEEMLKAQKAAQDEEPEVAKATN